MIFIEKTVESMPRHLKGRINILALTVTLTKH